MMQSWITRHSVPKLRTAAEVSAMTGVDLHDLLTEKIDAAAALAHARVRRRMLAQLRPPTPVARPAGCVGRGLWS